MGAVTDPSLHPFAEGMTDGDRLHEALGTHNTVAVDRNILKHQLRLAGSLLLLEIKHKWVISALSST